MLNNAFFHFLTLQLFKERAKHMAVVLLSVIILFLLSSVLFLSSSIRYSLTQTLEVQPDFVVTQTKGGEKRTTPLAWADELLEIYGVNDVSPRVYGRYFAKSKERFFLIVGVDFLEEQSHQSLKKLLNTTDLKAFFKEDNMLVGEGVKEYLSQNFYEHEYNFLTPKGAFKKVHIFKTLPSQSNLIANDMIVMPIELAREILGYDEEEVSDITFNVPNPDEWETISDKVLALHYNLKVTNKKEVENAYENLYNYKGGFFLMLFLVLLSTFVLILYQRYSMVYSNERRNIGLLRALGWSINDVLKLKFLETISVLFISFVLGVVLAYVYVFVFDAPLLQSIFLGGSNMRSHISFTPILDFSVLSSIFLMYALPFMASVLIPVWRVAVTDPKEAML